MLCQLRNIRGFTLIELMLVLAIISILATIAIVNMITFTCKAKQAEAKAMLGNIAEQQEIYFHEYTSYSSSLTRIGFGAKSDLRYSYSIMSADTASFTARATSSQISKSAIDVWTMNQSRALVNTTNACH